MRHVKVDSIVKVRLKVGTGPSGVYEVVADEGLGLNKHILVNIYGIWTKAIIDMGDATLWFCFLN